MWVTRYCKKYEKCTKKKKKPFGKMYRSRPLIVRTKNVGDLASVTREQFLPPSFYQSFSNPIIFKPNYFPDYYRTILARTPILCRSCNVFVRGSHNKHDIHIALCQCLSTKTYVLFKPGLLDVASIK